MSITLPIADDHWPLFRILTAPRWNNGAGPWTIQPMWQKKRRGYGFFVENFSRACLPAIGEATLSFEFGVIDGDLVGVRPASDTGPAAGNPWSTATDTAEAPDLHMFEIRIQAAPYVLEGTTPAWRTVWLGQCELQTDEAWPGAAYPAGKRTYYCVDGLARTRRWFMNKHGVYSNGSVYPPPGSTENGVYGHPGYNVGLDGVTIGNRESSGAGYNPQPDCTDNKCFYHAFQGAFVSPALVAATWSDLQACEHALRATRPLGEPLLSFVGDTTLLSQCPLPWPIGENDIVFDFLCKICKRERGRGVVFYDWADDVSDPTGTIAPKLTVLGQFGSPYTGVSDPTTGLTITIPASGSTTTVDIIGDHRNIDGLFSLSDAGQWREDAIETVGNPIEVLATLSYYDFAAGVLSIEKGWDTSIEAAFAALAPFARADDSWRFLWTLHRLPLTWLGMLGDGNGTLIGRGDYSCNDGGIIGLTNSTSPLLTKILPDIPLYEGYLYNGLTPTRRETVAPVAIPARRPPLGLLRTGTDLYITTDTARVNINVVPGGIMVYNSDDLSNGVRTIGDSSLPQRVYDISNFAMTVGLQMPHRMRMRTYRTGVYADTARRVRRIEHPELHLWLAHPGAIWDRNCAPTTTSPAAGRRNALFGTATNPGWLRDDRAKLAQLHALACAWYLQNRRSAKWGLKCCGFLPGFDNCTDISKNTTVAVSYPTIGQLISTIAAAGQTYTLNTPLTFVSYDNRLGQTIWQTDWQDKDFY